MPETVDYRALQTTSRDAEAIQTHLQKRAERNIEILENPSKNQIISKLDHIDSVYLAYHGGG